jgi:hypothetical protein
LLLTINRKQYDRKPKKENNIPENAKGIERRKVVIGYSNRGGGKS